MKATWKEILGRTCFLLSITSCQVYSFIELSQQSFEMGVITTPPHRGSQDGEGKGHAQEPIDVRTPWAISSLVILNLQF